VKLQKLSCPNCNGKLNMKVENSQYIFCPYCGQEFFIDDGKKVHVFNRNEKKDININKSINYTHRKVDDADIIRAKSEANEKRNGWIAMLVYLCVMVALIAFCFFMANREEKDKQEAIAAGKIQAGFHEDYLNENYEAVVQQFEILGFQNISTVDLNDAGLAIWNSDKVESVSISGNASFYSDDYFDPNEKVIITYH